MPPPTPPPKIKAEDSDTLVPVAASYAEFKIGAALATEGEEVTVFEVYIENDAGETIVGYRKTITLVDETDGTEDVTMKEYALTNGTLVQL